MMNYEDIGLKIKQAQDEIRSLHTAYNSSDFNGPEEGPFPTCSEQDTINRWLIMKICEIEVTLESIKATVKR